MTQYALEGVKKDWGSEETKTFFAQSASVSDALRDMMVAANGLDDEKQNDEINAKYSFALYFATQGGQRKLVLTVCGSGYTWYQALREAYIRVCGWQLKEPDLAFERKTSKS